MLLVAQVSANAVLLLMLVLVISFIMMRNQGRAARGRGVDGPDAAPERGSPSPTTDPQAVASKFEVALHERFREMEARLDTKIAVLDRLVLDAAQQIGRLQALLKTPSCDGAADLERLRPAPAAADKSVGAAEPVCDAGDGGGPDRTPAAGGRRARIYALADEGLSPECIAARVGMPPGEVQLVLRLRRTRSRAA